MIFSQKPNDEAHQYADRPDGYAEKQIGGGAEVGTCGLGL